MDSGNLQVLKLCAAESTYGETVSNPTWAPIGLIITGGENASEVEIEKHYGIGSEIAQAMIPGEVSNSLRAELVAPTAAAMNMAVTRTSGVLGSYNFIAGQGGTAKRGVGLKFNSLSVDIPEKGGLKATLDGIYKSLLTATVDSDWAAPSTTPVWRRDGCVLTVAGSADTEFISAQFTVGNNLSKHGQDNSTANQKRVLKALLEGGLDISATIQTMTAPTFNLEADVLGCTPITLTAVFTDLCGGGTPGTLTFTLEGGVYKRKAEPLVPGGVVNYSVVIEFTEITIA
jgi:hypothetical protein